VGKFLNSENDGLEEAITGTVSVKTFPSFAVFDGMGGEQQGEMAAYIATTNFDVAYKDNPPKDIKQFLLDTCITMNEAICKHTEEQDIKSSGTTAAIIMFDKKHVHICNIGDSRIYQFRNNTLLQLSHDHSATSIKSKKQPLSQCLGIPKTEFLIEPYVAKEIFYKRDKYLICSDGLTDMISDDDIAKIISINSDLSKCADILMQKALESGGRDNITIILCEIHKRWLNIFNFK